MASVRANEDEQERRRLAREERQRIRDAEPAHAEKEQSGSAICRQRARDLRALNRRRDDELTAEIGDGGGRGVR